MKASVWMVGAAMLCLTCGAPAHAEVRRGATSVFADLPGQQSARPKTVSKSAQRKRAALQQRVLLEQQQLRRSSGSVEQNLDRLRRQQAETLRAQQYGHRYTQKRMPLPDLQPRPSDPIGQRLDALRQQQADTLRDQQRTGSQQSRETQDAMRRLRN